MPIFKSIFRASKQNGALVYRGQIFIASDFPTLAQVAVGDWYNVMMDVTDNNPSKTNTGQSFQAGDEIFWNGTSWSEVGSIDLASLSATSPINYNSTTGNFSLSYTSRFILTGGALDLASPAFSLAGENYLSFNPTTQTLTANSINLSGSNVMDILPYTKGGTGTDTQEAFGVNFFDGTKITSESWLYYFNTPGNRELNVNDNTYSSMTVETYATSGQSESYFQALRGHNGVGGFAGIKFLTSAGYILNWQIGTRQGDDNLHFYDGQFGGDRLVLTTSGLVNLPSLASGTYANFVCVDSSKNLISQTTANVKTILNLAGTNSGDVTLAGENYLSIAGQIITANAINLAGTNVNGTLPNSKTTATNLNTALAIVARDSSGNFTAGTITAALSGNATTASTLQTARNIGGVSFNGSANIVPQTIQTVDDTADATCFILFANSSGNQTSGQQPKTNSGLTYNATTNNLAATTFTGSLSGNATSATSLTGGALGSVPYQTGANTTTMLAGNTTTTKQYLSQTGNGTVSAAPVWATIAGSDITGAALTKTDDTNVTLTLGGTPGTALLRAASLTLGWTGQLANSRGGTGQDSSAWAQGDIPYISATGVWNHLPKDTNATRYLSNTGTTNNPAWAQINLANGVTGLLSGTNGGTGVNNGASTITIGGNVTFSGAFTTTFTITGNTSVTFPTSGTLATTAGTVSAISGENYLSLSLPTLTANPVNLGTTNVTGTLPLAKFTTAAAGRVLVSGTNPSWSAYPTIGGVTLNNLGAAGGMGLQAALYFDPVLADGNYATFGAAGRNIGVTNANAFFFSSGLDWENLSFANTYVYAAGSTPGTTAEITSSGFAIKTAPGGTINSAVTPTTMFSVSNAGLVNISQLAISRLVGTDGSSNLAVVNLSGDVTTSGGFATTIANQAVTYAKIQNVSATNRILGRSTAGAGIIEEITVGSGLSLSGGTLTSTGLGGTVTSVSGTNLNGFTFTITNPTTTPNISLGISDTRIDTAQLVDYVIGTNTAITSSDVIFQGFGKAQAQINARPNVTLAGENYLSISTQTITANAINLAGSNVTGTLGVGKGGTGTATTFTQGSIVFAGASGVYSQDNANLNFNSTTGKLSVHSSTFASFTSAYLQVGADAATTYGSFDQSTAVSVFVSKTNNGGTTPAASEPVMTWVRQGIAGQAYNNIVDWKISRVAGSEVNSQIALGLLAGDGTLSATTTITTWSTVDGVLTTSTNGLISQSNSTLASGGSGDFTNVVNPTFKCTVSGTNNYIRAVHISSSSTISTVYNYQTGKNVFWGEDNDTGTYYFRGRTVNIRSLGSTPSLVAINSSSDLVTTTTGLTPTFAALNLSSGVVGTATKILNLNSPRSSPGSTDGTIITGIGGTQGTNDYGAIAFLNNQSVNDPGAGRTELRVGGTASNASNNGIFLRGTATAANTVTDVSVYVGGTQSLQITNAGNNVDVLAGNLLISLLGKKLTLRSGTNGAHQQITLTGTTTTIANTSVTANTKVVPIRKSISGAVGTLTWTSTAGVGYTITSSSGTDAGLVDVYLIEIM